MVERLTDTPGSLVPTCRHTHVHPAERRSSPPGWAPGAQPVPVLTHVVSSRDTMSVLPAQLPVRSWNQACHPQRQACGLLCCRRERPTHCSLPLVSVPELSRTRSSPSEYSGNTHYPLPGHMSPVLRASPSDQPPFWPVLHTCVWGGEDGTPRNSPKTRVHPGPSGHLLILPAQPAPHPILSVPMLVHPSQDLRHDCPYTVSFRELKYVIQRFAEDPRQEVRPPSPWRAHCPAAGRLPDPLGHPDSSHGPPAFTQTQPLSCVSEPSP